MGEGSEISYDGYVDIFSTNGLSSRKKSLYLVNAGVNDEPLIEAGERSVDEIIGWLKSISMVCPKSVFWSMLDRGFHERPGTNRRDEIIDVVNDYLASEMGIRFLNVRAYLASEQALVDALEYNPSFTSTQDDEDAVAGDYCPPSFRASSGTVHLNELGHYLQSKFILQALRTTLSDLL
ncbi:hypothetical protein [Celeribacter halophilus]|uniref:hypothetical protein n=1 Tax=Celeribacter halophilus TaxID=576117 RepID=UPI000835D1D2|nr:hypothetical protein [Celeribacter halophilus]